MQCRHMKGWLVVGVGRSKVVVGHCQDGISSPKDDPDVPVVEDVVVPEEGKAVIWDRW